MPVQGGLRACLKSTAQQTATTAVGLELGRDDGLDGTIASDGTRSRCVKQRDDRFSLSRERASDDRKGDIPIVPSRNDQGDGALSDSHQVRSPRSRPCVYGQRRCALFIERSLSFESPVRAGG